jgi:hypothetical protein
MLYVARESDKAAARQDRDDLSVGLSVTHVSEQTSPWMKQALSEIKMYEGSQPPSFKYMSTRTLDAWSCGTLFVSGTQDDAIAHLKLRAKAMGANGIMNLRCESHHLQMRGVCPAEHDRPSGVHWEKDCSADYCMANVDCTGTPILVDPWVTEPACAEAGNATPACSTLRPEQRRP